MIGAEFVHPENAILFAEIEDLIFTPSTAKEWRSLHHRSGRPTTFEASNPSSDSGLELYVDYIPNHPRNLELPPLDGFKLPAFRFLRTDPEALLPTKFGNLLNYVLDSTGTEFYITISYFINARGQGIKEEMFEKWIDKCETEEERSNTEGKTILSHPISEEDSSVTPLKDEDRQHIRMLLEKYKAGEFENEEFGQDSGIR